MGAVWSEPRSNLSSLEEVGGGSCLGPIISKRYWLRYSFLLHFGIGYDDSTWIQQSNILGRYREDAVKHNVILSSMAN